MGVPVVGVATLAQAATVVGPSRRQAVLARVAAPAGRGEATVTAKVRDRELLGGRLPIGLRQRAPGLVSGAQIQPAELSAASKWVLAGTVSTSCRRPVPEPEGSR